MVTPTRSWSSPSDQTGVPVDNTGSGALITGIANQIIRLYRLAITFSAATTATFYNGDPGSGGVALSGPYDLLAGGSIVLDDSGNSWYTAAAGNDLYLQLSNGDAVVAGTAWVIQS